MSVVQDLLHTEEDGSISFGNHLLDAKAKVEDFEYAGDLLKVKTFRELTKLEKNGMFLYESEPGTSVNFFKETPEGVTFQVEGTDNAQITVGVEEETEYSIFINDEDAGRMKSNLGGKISLSVELGADPVSVRIVK